MSEMKALPAWPDESYFRMKAQWGDIGYERARAEAALARLRVAVEALRQQVAMVGGCDCHESYRCRDLTDPMCVYHNYEIEDVESALSSIGDIP